MTQDSDSGPSEDLIPLKNLRKQNNVFNSSGQNTS